MSISSWHLICICVHHAFDVWRGQTSSDSAELELQAMEVLGIEPGSSRREASALKHWAFPPTHTPVFDARNRQAKLLFSVHYRSWTAAESRVGLAKPQALSSRACLMLTSQVAGILHSRKIAVKYTSKSHRGRSLWFFPHSSRWLLLLEDVKLIFLQHISWKDREKKQLHIGVT